MEKSFTDSDLNFVRLENVSKQYTHDNLGQPAIWLQDRRTLVYGLAESLKQALYGLSSSLIRVQQVGS